MKKLNVQRDLDSRARIAETTILPVLPKPVVEPVTMKTDAQSQESKECTDNQSAPLPEGKKTKGRRTGHGEHSNDINLKRQNWVSC